VEDDLYVKGLNALGAWLQFLAEREQELQAKLEKLRQTQAQQPDGNVEAHDAKAADEPDAPMPVAEAPAEETAATESWAEEVTWL
jgi:hypothetical protein